MPSIHETFGLVYAEAISQGLPVIYSRGQGFDGRFVNGEIGYAVNALSVDEIVLRIKAIESEYKEISKMCLINADYFKWDLINCKYKKLYNCIIS